MPHLNATRKGWQNEHLGLFILSQFAFCASPVTISDDLGSDFFCCLFQTSMSRGTEVVRPLNSFAIQLKSGAKSFDASDKIGYLSELEIPFFVGVVKQMTLTIYSGEYLPLFFSQVGLPDKLRLQPVNRQMVSLSRYYERFGSGKFRLLCPYVATIKARSSKIDIKKVVRGLRTLCTRIHGNIATRRTEEHVYSIPGRHPYLIMAGPGSVKVFRNNFYLRLAEVFYNFVWLLENRLQGFDIDEARIYVHLFRAIRNYGAVMPQITIKRYLQFIAMCPELLGEQKTT